MSLIKSISMEIKNKPIQIGLPDKKTIILKGQNATQLLYVVESLLSQDVTGYYKDLDKIYGFDYSDLDGQSMITFNNGAIIGKNKISQVKGVVPDIHVVRYLGASNKLRSFYLSNTITKQQPIYNNMTHYSHIIEDSSWIRLIAIANSIVGFDMVQLKNNDLHFSFQETYPISVEGQKIVYLLLAECMLTPEGYSRVLLLPDINYLDVNVQIKLLEYLDNIKGHTLTLSLANISNDDLSVNSAITFVTV